MSTELLCLTLSALLACLLLIGFAAYANLTWDHRWLVGPRDESREFPVMIGRLKRAWDNHLESLILLTPAVLALELTERHSGLTAGAAIVYLAARVLYVPAYAAGVPMVRSIVWAPGFVATIVILIAALAG